LFLKWSNIGGMKMIYGQYCWLNLVGFNKRLIESKFVSLVKPKLAGGNQKGHQATIGWRPSCFEKWSIIGWMKMIYGP
jgi:hypothetical protein